MARSSYKICVLAGDGIGPEIMDETLRILDEAGAALELEEIKVGKDVYESGVQSGIDEILTDARQPENGVQGQVLGA